MNRELLIFGSNSPLGVGITKALSAKNYNKIYLFASNYENTSEGNLSRIKNADLSIEENVKQALALIKPSKDTLFFLYSTIGGYTGGKEIIDSSTGEFDRMMNINVKTSFLIAKYFTKLVKESAGGSIMFTSALTSLNPAETKGVYGASKEALNHLVETLSIEGKNYNLTVNAIAPNVIDTPPNMEWFTGDTETLIKPVEVGEFAHHIFEQFHFITGNIFKLKYRLNIKA